MEDISMSSRSLGSGGGGPVQLDYTVFAMAVLTMGLLLIVEVIRHGLDRMAQGRDFFETVLKTVYHELSTLGIVEATIFLVNQFFEVNLEKERIFADVHFTLFFVAIINALMACIIYLLSMMVAHQRWVKMETLDFNHYVAIRQEFDQVEAQMKRLRRGVEFNRTDTDTNDSSTPQYHDDNRDAGNGGTLITNIGKMMDKPNALKLGQHGTFIAILDRKYSELIVQIRFHDMRVHFIEKHNLPKNFRISDYLSLAMNDAFKEFVHISTRTWLALMGCANFMYFLMGIVTYASSSTSLSSYDYSEIVPVALSWIFIGYCLIFILISFFISIKMDKIFRSIIAKDSWSGTIDTTLIKKPSFFGKNLIQSSWSTSKDDLDTDGKSQKDQFWLGKPDLIIVFAQFMQFGFSVGFAILLVFQKTVRAGNVFEWWGWYFVAPLLCFFIFIWLWSVIIPLYTQCTNLGDLVSKRHLIEIEAMSQLEDERKKRQQYTDYVLAEKDVTENMKKKRSRMKSRDRTKKVRIRTKSAKSSEGIFSDETLEQISEFVKSPTKDLPRRSRNTSITSDASNDSFFSPGRMKEEQTGKHAEGNEVDTTIKSFSIEVKARNFFLSNGYQQASTMFGTFVAFYLLALRVQVMLIQTCEMKDRDAIWYFLMREPRHIFWIVIGWFSAFIVESFMIIIIFGREKDQKNFFMVVAGCLDIIVTSASVALFCIAEFYRCCGCSSDTTIEEAIHSNIFTASTGNYISDDVTDLASCIIDAELSCCPSFGTRLCGGIGIIEPFAALIGLRIFRFFFAQSIVKTNDASNDIKVEHDESIDEQHHKEDFSDKTGTIAELWITALTQYTDVVKRHGILSANLLESMLGIDTIPEPESTNKDVVHRRVLSSRDALSTAEKTITLERPHSPLIRSMRRCACKLFPFLNDKWQIVDVVLTDYEIVWFDVNVDLLTLGDNDRDIIYSVKERLRETKGGKSLRLSEAAFGRTILGRLSLSDLEQVVIQKISQQSEFKEDAADSDIEKMRSDSWVEYEYWTSNSIPFHDRVENWFDMHHCSKQLKLRSSHGILYLQFFADRETFGTGDSDGATEKVEDIALLWCRTIAELRGEKDLKQKLPNLGSKDEEKYLVETISRKDLDRGHNDGQMSTRNIFQIFSDSLSRKNIFE